ncbi:MAG: MarR family transcriptional regulator [Roseibium sp.]|uniref:MarR family winged helix-turn-helix transcriptional regulator n=1 Tax=Roseibium sp. TaxID=1936156 RepID=UPI00261A3C48|nr:winged helix DNA-binding protein [Roseibium sp.]MCV0424909.1 MarR family transcriptional regulator [Roseibium sp.]
MKPSDRETHIWIMLNRAHRQAHRNMETELREKGLPSLRVYDLLWGVEMSGTEGVRAYELTDWLLFEQSNLSRLLAQLVSKGLIRETVLAADRRGKVLHITPEGAALRKEMWEIYGPGIQRHMRQLASAEGLQEFLDQLCDVGGGPIARRNGQQKSKQV